MTEDAVEMVECALSGISLEKDKAIEYTINETGDVRYIDPSSFLDIATESKMANLVLQKIALTDKLFEKTISIREVAIAKNQGIQEGATAAIKRLKEVADVKGLDLEEVIKEAFAAPEDEGEGVPGEQEVEATSVAH